ncbi:MAG: methyltransferase domain-containing protein [Pseudonocardiaceae bacterium]
MSYPTDLNPGERELAAARLRELAERFTADGVLRTPQWREVFLRTWCHPYVPSFYPTLDAPCLLSIDPQRRDDWLAAVYSDQTLITKVVQVPMSPALRPGSYPVYTSSSTMPSLVLRMLEALDVHDGHRVLEIGTGTGYNAALLCARLGSEHVTSVDVDPELTELAAERLASNGYTPTLAAVDGAGGYPPGAPYDRIIATCAVPAIPPAWLAQAAPGAIILADVHGPIGGTLARLTVGPGGVATGRFLPDWAGFMWLRHTPDIPDTTTATLAGRRTRGIGQRHRPGTAVVGRPVRFRRPMAPAGRHLGSGDRGQRACRPPVGTRRLPRLGARHPHRGRLPGEPGRSAPTLGPGRGSPRLLATRRASPLRTVRHHRHYHLPVRLVRPPGQRTPLATTRPGLPSISRPHQLTSRHSLLHRFPGPASR